MIITNKYNLPQTFVNIMKRPTYSKGKANISATELINSPRIVQLRKLHEDKIETDVTEMVWSIFGTAIHGVLEHGKDENHLIEERLHANIDGWSISGAIDLQIVNEDGTVTINDYKTTGAWSVMNEKIDWEYQLNIYAWLVEKVKATKVSKLEIVAIIRDWSRRDAAVKAGYPDAPIKVIPIQLWPMEQRESFIQERIKEHSNALFDLETGDELPFCTPDQMWEKQTTYAVKKTGNVKARNVCATEEEALAKVAEYGQSSRVWKGVRDRSQARGEDAMRELLLCERLLQSVQRVFINKGNNMIEGQFNEGQEQARGNNRAQVTRQGAIAGADPWAHRAEGMRCKTCIWFVPKQANNKIGYDIGRCRRHAPTMGGYPVVYVNDWCGDHRIDENKV